MFNVLLKLSDCFSTHQTASSIHFFVWFSVIVNVPLCFGIVPHLILQFLALRKHAYSNVLKILQPTKENFQIKKKLIFFHISAQNIDCGYMLDRLIVAFLTSTHNLCFRAKIRKVMLHLFG